MKRTLIIAFAAIAALASCAKEEFAGRNTLSINFSQDPEFKTHMSSSKATWWDKGDAISVFSNTGSKYMFTTSGNAAAVNAFTCPSWVEGQTPEWSVYSYGADGRTPYGVTMTGEGRFTAYVSDNQLISSANSSFGSKSNVSVGKIVSMVGGDFSCQMLNALGLVQITLPAALTDIESVKLEDAAGTAGIAGTVEIDFNEGTPVCTLASDARTAITATYERSGVKVFPEGYSLFFCVIPNVSFIPKFTFTKTDGSKASVTGNMAISVGRNKYVNLGTPTLEFIPAGYRKDVAVVDFSNSNPADAASWPLSPSFVSVSNQKKEEYKDVLYTLPGTLYSFDFVRASDEVTTSSGTGLGTFEWKAGYIRTSAYSDGAMYIKINVPDGGQIASVKIYAPSNATQPATVTDASGTEVVWSSNIVKSSSVLVDVSQSTSAKYGCRINFTKAKGSTYISKLEITYIIPEED